MKKRGASPLIATVLIIGMVVAASAVVFIWGKGYTEELIEKSQGAALTKLNCVTDIAINIIRHDSGYLTVENIGRGKIDAFTLVNQDGDSFEELVSIDPGNIEKIQYYGEKITVIPKIRIAKGLYQPCSGQKLTYKI